MPARFVAAKKLNGGISRPIPPSVSGKRLKTVTCLSCDAAWHEMYQMVDVERVEQN